MTANTRKQAIAVSAAFREVNERIAEVADSWLDSGARELVCECGDATCTEAIAVARSDYQEARKRPGHFLVTSGHVGDELGTEVFQQRDGYATIEYGEDRPLQPGTSDRTGMLDDFETWVAEELPRVVADAKSRYGADAGAKITPSFPSTETTEPEPT